MNLDILKIASDTNNNKNIKNYTHHSKLKNSMCGDEMQIDLIIKKIKLLILVIKVSPVFIVKLQQAYFQKFQLMKISLKLMNCVTMQNVILTETLKILKKNGNHLIKYLMIKIYLAKNVFYYLLKQ